MNNQFETLRDKFANLRRVYEARNEKDFAKLSSLLITLLEQNEALTSRLDILERKLDDEIVSLKYDVEILSSATAR